MSVVQHLQKDIEHVRMRLLDLIKENDRVGIPSHLLRELAALFVADIAGRRTYNLRNRMLLHVLTHIDTDQCLFGTEHRLGERLRKFGFTDTGRSEEEEGADRAVRVFETDSTATNCARYRAHRLFLTDHALVKDRLQFL